MFLREDCDVGQSFVGDLADVTKPRRQATVDELRHVRELSLACFAMETNSPNASAAMCKG